jgi:hypothetical protein
LRAPAAHAVLVPPASAPATEPLRRMRPSQAQPASAVLDQPVSVTRPTCMYSAEYEC